MKYNLSFAFDFFDYNAQVYAWRDYEIFTLRYMCILPTRLQFSRGDCFRSGEGGGTFKIDGGACRKFSINTF